MDVQKPETKQGFGVGQLGVFVSCREKILFWDDCSSVIPQTVSLSCTLMSELVSQHLAQQWCIIQKSYQQFRNKSFWMLQPTTNNRCFPLKITCLFSLRALYFNLRRADKEHLRCVLFFTGDPILFFTGDHCNVKNNRKTSEFVNKSNTYISWCRHLKAGSYSDRGA